MNQHLQSNNGPAGLLSRLSSTREYFVQGLTSIFDSGNKLNEDAIDDIEDQLLMSDIGVEATRRIITETRRQKVSTIEAFTSVLRATLLEVLEPCDCALDVELKNKPFVILMIGVNGVGKTTTLAKISNYLKGKGRRITIAACDTFRAAAIEQLQSWGQQLEIDVIAQQHGADPAAVAHDAWNSASSRGSDVLLVDTAGRQHTNEGLMDQLVKVQRVLSKLSPEAPHEVLLTLDAGTGQNALSQFAQFNARIPITGICLSKLDGTAKGGIIVALAQKYGVPIRFVGTGEALSDFSVFNRSEFVEALLPDPPGENSRKR